LQKLKDQVDALQIENGQYQERILELERMVNMANEKVDILENIR